MFITFEGIDCSGKSTQARLLAEKLREAQHDIVELREPGNTRLSEHIREILLNKDYSEINERTELLLFAASRAQLVAEVILPSLQQEKIVICDRFSDSTIAYQGYGRGLPLDDIIHINRIATQETEPDMTFYLDISPETALERTAGREGVVQDRMEEAGITFFERVIHGYMRVANINAGRYFVVDGGKSVDEIQGIIWRLVSERLKSESRYSISLNGTLEPMVL
ncbi:MAG: dTMP kinase [Ignavibacteriae bacterium]|nr:dTMP kinase [Ignavibacteriota bacterium]MCB9216006.1 dTMP kinase [Ignavibacteria bacterium]